VQKCAGIAVAKDCSSCRAFDHLNGHHRVVSNFQQHIIQQDNPKEIQKQHRNRRLYMINDTNINIEDQIGKLMMKMIVSSWQP